MENENFTLIAYCGLVCSNCYKYKNGKCPGCQKNEKATWCAIRKCNIENKFTNCSECIQFTNAADCKKMNNFIGKFFSLIFKTDRLASVNYIRAYGKENYARRMNEKKQMAFKRNDKIE